MAFCEDGYADVIEAEDKDVYIGVRFHPESLYRIDKNMNNIFSCFIEKCKRKKRRESDEKYFNYGNWKSRKNNFKQYDKREV